jgi:hypothetical protein
MKRFALVVFGVVVTCLFTGWQLQAAAEPADFRAADSRGPEVLPQARAPWSVVGVWKVRHPDWSGTLTLEKNGEFTRTEDHDSGHWTLTALHDRVVLVLAWDHWPAETVTMISPDEFCSKVRGQAQEGDMTLQRMPAAAARFTFFETAKWRQGEPPVRLIRQEEGFCALTQVTGSFQGSGESVRVYVGDDGYWYLGGDSHQEGVGAECIVIRYARPE